MDSRMVEEIVGWWNSFHARMRLLVLGIQVEHINCRLVTRGWCLAVSEIQLEQINC